MMKMSDKTFGVHDELGLPSQDELMRFEAGVAALSTRGFDGAWGQYRDAVADADSAVFTPAASFTAHPPYDVGQFVDKVIGERTTEYRCVGSTFTYDAETLLAGKRAEFQDRARNADHLALNTALARVLPEPAQAILALITAHDGDLCAALTQAIAARAEQIGIAALLNNKVSK